jgi:dolichyl-phosphate-mannose-protein mannosyltransferase
MARTRGKSPQPPVKAQQQQPVVQQTQPPQQQQAIVKPKNKSDKKKTASYKSDGVEDNDVFLLPVSDYWVVLALTVLSTVVRVFKIFQPTSVVFDEVQ